ncbi:hypothetical protein [Salisediminibacterium selenitireducens]|uniref:hypothetical protein n=1 Tax=Salisediminibacterium selenitireducens TaxID=85683 RepID=UPI0002EDA0B4|nr:hypothetical protein [Salisediminibacterium selenitireducens]
MPLKLPLKLSAALLSVFTGLLVLLPILRASTDLLAIQLFDSFTGQEPSSSAAVTWFCRCWSGKLSQRAS